ncbi:transcriptional regulator, LysR family [Burkholderia sp. D7]|nr:transcriptional regulator, LysR family [Burkholderia sp. D7]
MVDVVQNMRIFVRVVEARSFTAVARENDSAAAQVSRAVAALEEHLQTVVLHRTTRHLSLTDAGAKFYERAKAILADLDNATDEARNATSRPQGRIRVHSSPGLAQSNVTTALVSYQALNPDVSVELDIIQTMPNLVEDGYDISLLSATQLPDSAYVAQALGTAYSVLVASPAYLRSRGVPKTPSDLSKYHLLRLDSPVSPPDEWRLEGPGGELLVPVRTSPFQANSPEALRAAIDSGAGIGTLATYSVCEDLKAGKLTRVLPQFRLRPFTVFALYASRRYLDAKIRTLLDHLRETLSPALEEFAREVEALTERRDESKLPQ